MSIYKCSIFDWLGNHIHRTIKFYTNIPILVIFISCILLNWAPSLCNIKVRYPLNEKNKISMRCSKIQIINHSLKHLFHETSVKSSSWISLKRTFDAIFSRFFGVRRNFERVVVIYLMFYINEYSTFVIPNKNAYNAWPKSIKNTKL